MCTRIVERYSVKRFIPRWKVLTAESAERLISFVTVTLAASMKTAAAVRPDQT